MTQTRDTLLDKSAGTGIRTQALFNIETFTEKQQGIYFEVLNFDFNDLVLNSRQINKITKLARNSAKMICENKKLNRNSVIDYEEQYYITEFEREYKKELLKETNRTIERFNKLKKLLSPYLEITRNNFSKQEFLFEELVSELKEDIHEYINTQNMYGNGIPYPSRYTHKYIKTHLIKTEHTNLGKYLDLYQKIHNIENNIEWSFTYLDKFLQTGEVTYFQTAINDLASCGDLNFKLEAQSGFKVGLKYYSRGKFCAFSRNILVQKHKDLLINAINYYEKYNKTYSFLTIAPKNIFDLNKDDMLNLGLILKKFFEHDEIKEVYSGYFGVPEIVYKQNNEYNVHFHFLTLRDVEMGYIHHGRLKEIFKDICNKYGTSKIKGSFMVDIKAPQFQAEDPSKVLPQVANYILQYITKGIKINSSNARLNLIDALDGIRMFRSGGDLAKNKLQEISIKNEFKSQLETIEKLPQIQKFISIGGNKYNSPVQVNSNSIFIKKLFGYSNDRIISSMLFEGRKKTPLYQEIQKSMFKTSTILCPVTNQDLDIAKVHFAGMSKFRGSTNIKESLFLVDALAGLELENESLQLAHTLGFNFSKIYENDLVSDLLSLGINY